MAAVLQCLRFLFLLLFGLASPAAVAQELSPLVIETTAGPQRFQVEVADDDASRSRGLMFRRSLEADRGMLFDFERPLPVTMWMRNTYVSLDMIFIRPDGRIHRIEQRTTPLSERTIEAGDDVRFVLEVVAGTAQRLGLKRGDRVRHALIPS